jgi:hypothetical protein
MRNRPTRHNPGLGMMAEVVPPQVDLSEAVLRLSPQTFVLQPSL